MALWWAREAQRACWNKHGRSRKDASLEGLLNLAVRLLPHLLDHASHVKRADAVVKGRHLEVPDRGERLAFCGCRPAREWACEVVITVL